MDSVLRSIPRGKAATLVHNNAGSHAVAQLACEREGGGNSLRGEHHRIGGQLPVPDDIMARSGVAYAVGPPPRPPLLR